jgi:hypothetical protein
VSDLYLVVRLQIGDGEFDPPVSDSNLSELSISPDKNQMNSPKNSISPKNQMHSPKN